jgi:branched-chain amino acid transport system ATP-binding protein
MMLNVSQLHVAYGRVAALHGVDLHVDEGEIVAVLGSNGAGKSSLLRAIVGQAPVVSGTIAFEEEQISRVGTDKIVRRGLTLVPEGRRVFPRHTVEDNLRLGAFPARNDRARVERSVEEQFDRFPILREKRKQPAWMLSGGQQQMLAIARALMSSPRLLMLDEPSLGLAPQIVARVFDAIADLAKRGLTVLLVDQAIDASLAIAKRAYILKNGAVFLHGSANDVRNDPHVREAYLGAGAL